MKYTTKIKQSQYAGGVLLSPQGGDLTEDQVKAIEADPWGLDLLSKKLLVIEEVTDADVQAAEEQAAKAPKKTGRQNGKVSISI
jgi:hypothetical protein